ncbi:MAG: hypothetical protein HYZ36_05050, partial [Pedosphaera parvula]|nr:hypothetical protein [Pedosphaera parvula]
ESAFGEEGSGTGISICFDTWDNNGDDTAPAIDVKVGGTIIATAYSAGQREGGRARPGPILKTPSGQDFDLRTGPQFADVRIEWRDGLLTLNYKGFDVFKSLPAFLAPVSAPRFGMGARTGGATDNQWVDNLGIQTFPPSTTPAITSFTGSPLGVTIEITDANTQVNQSSIQLKFDGAAVTPQVSKSGAVTTIKHTTPSVLAAGSTHAASLTYADTAGASKTVDFSYAVAPYIALPANLVTATGAVDKTKPGFRIRPYETEENNPNSLAWTEEQLAGLHGPNLADLSGADASGFYIRDSVINFDIGAGAGNFQPDDPFPGLPGTGSLDGGTGNAAMEILTFLEFPQAGAYIVGVNSDDGFRVSTAKNLQDPFG